MNSKSNSETNINQGALLGAFPTLFTSEYDKNRIPKEMKINVGFLHGNNAHEEYHWTFQIKYESYYKKFIISGEIFFFRGPRNILYRKRQTRGHAIRFFE